MHNDYLIHYGVKGMKWGVRRSPEELARARQALESSDERSIIYIKGHKGSPPTAEPNSIIDHVAYNGKVDKRSYYDENGIKIRDVHTTDHGNPKKHPYGVHGEHAHDYAWNDDGSMNSKIDRPLTDLERKENEDIL